MAGELDGCRQGSRAPSAGQRASGGAKLAPWPPAGWAATMERLEGQGLTAGCDSPQPQEGAYMKVSGWEGEKQETHSKVLGENFLEAQWPAQATG